MIARGQAFEEMAVAARTPTSPNVGSLAPVQSLRHYVGQSASNNRHVTRSEQWACVRKKPYEWSCKQKNENSNSARHTHGVADRRQRVLAPLRRVRG